MKTQSELIIDLQQVKTQQEKTLAEIKGVQDASTTLQQRITELEAIIAAGGTVSQELQDAVAAVKVGAQAVDDAIPDAPVAGASTTLSI